MTDVIENEFQKIRNQYLYQIIEIHHSMSRTCYAIVVGLKKSKYDIKFFYTPICVSLQELEPKLQNLLTSEIKTIDCFSAYSVLCNAMRNTLCDSKLYVAKSGNFSKIEDVLGYEKEIKRWLLKNKLLYKDLFLDFD